MAACYDLCVLCTVQAYTLAKGTTHTPYYAAIALTTSVGRLYLHWTKPVYLAKYWLWLPDDSSFVNRNMGSEVLQCNDDTSNKVSNMIRSHIDNRKLLLICILLLSHSLLFLRLFFIQYMVVFLFNTKSLCILIVAYIFLFFVHVFLFLSMYTYCYLRILRRCYPEWGFSVLFPRL
jgi:hypothetical protein